MRLVVTDTDSHTHGERARISSITLSLPTPDGPDRTTSRAAGRASSSMFTACFYPESASHSSVCGKLSKQCLSLLLAQAAQTAAVSDLQLLHDLGRPDLADAG